MDGLAVRKRASWDDSAVDHEVQANEVFTIAERPIKVGGGRMYKLKSGLYITAAEKYVSDRRWWKITLYAVWDDCPWIELRSLVYLHLEAQVVYHGRRNLKPCNGNRPGRWKSDFGEPIRHRSDQKCSHLFPIPDTRQKNLQICGAARTSENLTVVDHVGNTYVKQIMVHVTDTTPKKLTQMDLTGVTRFINSKYYNKSFEEGGLEDNSIWKVDPEYKAALKAH